MKNILLIIAAVLCISCADGVVSGVSYTLAQERKAAYSDVEYVLHFEIPEAQDAAITASEEVRLNLDRPQRIVLDFRPGEDDYLGSVVCNNETIDVQIVDEHIVIPPKATQKGHNTIEIQFRAGEQSLNRRGQFLYTLLVPDRARTLFPCFDQPDIKARYSLSLSVPEGWTAVSNTAVQSVSENGTVTFAQTEPLSTYLFSFVAGIFESATGERDGRQVTLYHRETDPAKVAQCPKILEMVLDDLEYMEDYTGVPYPFAKYDLIVLPDFQYGGMEHTGATLYNDRRIFLSEHPTTDELLSRASLIAHETAHMWFGDFVTMRWFDDVWTKEVFANWFASQICRPAFPEVNHRLNDLKTLYAPAYTEDRTVGSNAIRRPLDNLSHAGLIYCNIIYDKAPVVMDMLSQILGPEAFRQGLHDYLTTYGYANADWDELIACLEAAMPSDMDFDIREWSRVWVKEPGMPIYSSGINGQKVTVTQTDPFGQGNVWPQSVTYAPVTAHSIFQCEAEGASSSFDVGEDVLLCVPNFDGKAYGCFRIDDPTANYLYDNYSLCGETVRMSMLMTLYENVWRGWVAPQGFIDWASGEILHEQNSLIHSSLLDYASSICQLYPECSPSGFTTALRALSADPNAAHELRLAAFRKLFKLAGTDELVNELYEIWKSEKPYEGLVLSESDYTSLAYELMIRLPEKYDEILKAQSGRITNPDRLETFEWVSRATAPEAAERAEFFRTLLSADGRAVESRARTALGLLCHPSRAEEAVAYIRPALEALEDVQRTGDIFFPANWCSALLGSMNSQQAYTEVQSFIEDHPDYDSLLETKILQSAGFLYNRFSNN